MKMTGAMWRMFILSVVSVFTFTIYAAGADSGKPVVFQPIDIKGINPAEVDEGALRPGLASRYYLEFFERDLQELPRSDHSKYPSFPGKPVLQLNHQFDKQNIFDSGTNRGVGLRMKGYINFPKTGQYQMQALSNDGFILYLSGELTINDPEQHSDRLSNIANVAVKSPGWYQVEIEYFQRKGTAALKLMWKLPGIQDFVPLPPSAYAHIP